MSISLYVLMFSFANISAESKVLEESVRYIQLLLCSQNHSSHGHLLLLLCCDSNHNLDP